MWITAPALLQCKDWEIAQRTLRSRRRGTRKGSRATSRSFLRLFLRALRSFDCAPKQAFAVKFFFRFV